MKIALLASETSFTSKALATSAKKFGHTLDRVDVKTLSLLDLQHDKVATKLLSYDVVYPRTGLEKFGKSLLGDFLIKHGVYFVNKGYVSQPSLISKIYQTMIAKRAGMDVPETLTARLYHPSLFSSARGALGTPFIAKTPYGALGKTVFLIRNKTDFAQLTTLPPEEPLLFQRYIPNTGDFRVFVVGAKVAGIYKRVPAEGTFKANISQGGHGELVTDPKLKRALETMALKITKKLQLEIAGVDIMKSEKDGKLYFIECNNIPNWKGLQATTGVRVSDVVIRYFETLPQHTRA